MGGLKLLEKHPISAKLIREWFMEKMIESLNDNAITDDFRQFMREQSIDDDKIGVMIDANPRMLLDVFDENDIYINIIRNNGKFMWGWSDNEEHSIKGELINTRKEAELFAVEAAFEILENKLSPKEEEIN
jgi:hypothetical protein